jgi:hypothetical protein
VLVVLAGALLEQAELIRCLALLLPQVAVEAHQILITPQVQAGQVAAVITIPLQQEQAATLRQRPHLKVTTAVMEEQLLAVAAGVVRLLLEGIHLELLAVTAVQVQHLQLQVLQ